MRLSEWIDVETIKKICHHTSTFAFGVVVATLGKPFIVFAQWISVLCGEPMPEWLIHGISTSDNLFIAYFAFCLLYRLARELWPFGSTHGVLIAFGLYGTVHNA